MDKDIILKKAKELEGYVSEVRRDLHRHPEVGFDLAYTTEKVKSELEKMGYSPQKCGKSGFVVTVGGKKKGKTFLLRADMDALPIEEEADVEYKSENKGKMHGCGHDNHTAMLLGAAKILKDMEDEIEGTVKLVFQPAEEIFKGALDMMENGMLENPAVDAGMMIHVLTGYPIPKGVLLCLDGGVSMSSCEQYKIVVKGKGGHGSAPHMSIDPITAAAHIHIALQEISSRELDPNAFGVFTTCKFSAGTVSNVIPDSAEMYGTIRTNDPTGKIGEQIKARMTEIAKGVGMAMRCDVDVSFFDAVPCMLINKSVADDAYKYAKELFGDEVVMSSSSGGGSEDFAYVSHRIPVTSFMLSVGNYNDGDIYSVHNPKAKFDDSVLWRGTAAYAQIATRWLEENK